MTLVAGIGWTRAVHLSNAKARWNGGFATLQSAAELDRFLEDKDSLPLLVDLRDNGDYESAHIPGFLNISLKDGTELLETWIRPFKRDKRVVLICYGGNRSARAFEKLVLMGFTHVVDYAPGYASYAAEKGLSFVPETGDCGCPK
jgi:rhodanese-related sulfurtransferase